MRSGFKIIRNGGAETIALLLKQKEDLKNEKIYCIS